MLYRKGSKRLSRSVGGDIFIMLILLLSAAFMALPIVYAVSSAFKPMNELFVYPPRFFVRHPTLDNFFDLFVIMGRSWVPFSRYLYNSLKIVVLGIVGNVLLGSLAAYALSKLKFRLKGFLNQLILLSLMFTGAVVQIPNYLTISSLGWLNTHWAIIVPSWASTLGLFLMKQFIDTMVDDHLLEAARVDGAGELHIFFRIAMPIVKPAWLTMIILLFQSLWGATGDTYIYSEKLKTLPYALNQIIAGGVSRAGVGAAVTLLMMLLPITVFIVNQSQIIETMGSSGIKD